MTSHTTIQATAGTIEETRGLSWLDRATLLAIGVVVLLVSISRVRALALRENELDALRLLRALASQPAPPGSDAHREALSTMVARDASLRRRIDDLELLDDGRLRRHGYLFDRAWLSPTEPMLRAWPWKHAETGLGAFVWTPVRGCLGHENADARFAGPERPPGAADIDSTWRRMPRR